jgi:hypothetical protein
MPVFSENRRKLAKIAKKGVQNRGRNPEKKVDIGLLSSVVKNGFWGENNALIRFMQKMAKREIPPFSQVQTETRKKTPKKQGFLPFFGPFLPFLAIFGQTRKKR